MYAGVCVVISMGSPARKGLIMLRTNCAVALRLVTAGALCVSTVAPLGCARSAARSAQLGDTGLAYPTIPSGMSRQRVVIEAFSVSPAVNVPEEMREIGADQLRQIAREQVRGQLGESGAFDPSYPEETGRSAVGPMRLIGAITRVELSGSVEKALKGFFGQSLYADGQTAEVNRELRIDMYLELRNEAGDLVSACSGGSTTSIPISYTVEVSAADEEGRASGAGRSSLKDGRVERSSLTPAFKYAANVSAQRLSSEAIARHTAIANTVAATPR